MWKRILVVLVLTGMAGLSLPRALPCGPGAPAPAACCDCPATPVMKASCCCPPGMTPVERPSAVKADTDGSPLTALVPVPSVADDILSPGDLRIRDDFASFSKRESPPLFLLTGRFLS